MRLGPSNQEALRQVLAQTHPGAVVLGTRRLGGGLSADVRAVELLLASGRRDRVVLRRQDPGSWSGDPEIAARETKTLMLLARTDVRVPKLLFADPAAVSFDGPVLVMAFAGRPLVAPQREALWVRELAHALVAVHGVTPSEFDLSHLLQSRLDDVVDSVERALSVRLPADPLGSRVKDRLRRCLGEVESLGPTLVHDDYHPGNTLWRRGRLSAIVDWTKACTGDPRLDIAQCRSEVAAICTAEASDQFLREYESVTARRVPDLWFFDLIQGARALMFHQEWLPAYGEQGLRGVDAAEVRARIVAFLERALKRAL